MNFSRRSAFRLLRARDLRDRRPSLSLPHSASLAISSGLFLLSTIGLELPTYNMAWGAFSHEFYLGGSSLVLAPTRMAMLLLFGSLTIVLLARAIPVLSGLLGARFTILLVSLLALSAPTLVPVRTLAMAIAPSPLLYAARLVVLSLFVIASGCWLAKRLDASRCIIPTEEVGGARSFRWAMLGSACVVLVGLIVYCTSRLDGIPHAMDEIGQIFQAKIFATGRFWVPAPPLPSVFPEFGIITDGGKWRAAWVPGNALALTPFVAANLLWLFPPVVAALTTWAVLRVARVVGDAPTSWVAIVLLLTSPFFWSMGSSYMSHGPSALFFGIFLASFARARKSGIPHAVLAGLFLGAGAATRPVDALLLSAPFGLLWALDGLRASRRREWVQHSFALLVSIVPGLVFLFLNNAIVNGSPLVFGFDVLISDPDRFGTEPVRPEMARLLMTTSTHTWSVGLLNLKRLITDLQVVLFGLGLPSLALPALALAHPARSRIDCAGLVALATFLGAYALLPVASKAFFVASSQDFSLVPPGSMFGPRYAYTALPLFVWLGARGVMAVYHRLRALGRPRVTEAVLAVGALVAITSSIPAALRSFDPIFAGVDRSLERALEEKSLRRAVVIVLAHQHDLKGNPFIYTSAFRLLDPDLSGIIPVTIPPGPDAKESVDDILAAFPDRPAFAWIALYEGDLVRFRLITTALIRLRRPGDPRYEPERERILRNGLAATWGSMFAGVGKAELWTALGTVVWLDGDREQGRQLLSRAASISSGDPSPWVNLALLEKAEGRLDAARVAAGKARSLGAHLPPPLAALLGPDTTELAPTP